MRNLLIRPWAAGLAGLLIVLTGCETRTAPPISFGPEPLRAANRALLETAMEDAFNPPQASRVYVYPHLAHLAVMRAATGDRRGAFLDSLIGWPGLPRIDTTQAHAELTALLSFARVARLLVFTEADMDSLAARMQSMARGKGMEEKMIEASRLAADSVAARFKGWIGADHYVETRTMDRYTSSREVGHWVETPLDYTAALEPHWSRIRPLALPVADYYRVPPMVPFSQEEGSDFWKMVDSVRTGQGSPTDSIGAIGLYWDDNPSITSHVGHLMMQEHRISPPGHWLNIISLSTRARNDDLLSTSQAYALAAVAMHDALINCWHEKYRTDVIRPITYIQALMDPKWQSLIQTPPFPEYPSGHSAVSAAAAEVLEALHGPRHAFTDSTEAIFGLGVRSFPGYHEAAWEVSLSRFYGGIHYMVSLREGNTMGRRVAERVMMLNATE